MKPKPQDTSRPSGLKDFSLPTAEESRPVPAVWGTVELNAPNITWYGDLQTVKLTKKVRTGLFSTTRLTLGFRYSIGMKFSLCHGIVDELLEVRTDDKAAFSGHVTGVNPAGENFTVDARTVYGGDSEEQLESGGKGGLYATCTFYNGSDVQTQNAYIQSVLETEVPADRGICYIMWNGPSSGDKVYNYDLGDPTIVFTREPFLSGYVGDSPNLTPISFIVRRTPNILSGAENTFYNINNGDANPADVLMELLQNDEWGMGLASGLINVESFKDAQEVLFNEGLGFSAIWDSQREITDVMAEVLKYIDGLIYVDLETGLVTIKLARNDYDENDIPVLDEDNVSEIVSFSRGTYDETTNEVQISYLDRFQKYKEKIAIAHDLANAQIQGDVVPVKNGYIGISNSIVANKIAQRDLRVYSIPLAKVILKMNRDGLVLRPANVFKLVWPDYELEGMVFRITRISYGQFDNAIMEVEAIQDVFSLGTNNVYVPPGPSGWEDPTSAPAAPEDSLAVEAPYHFSGDANKILVFAEPTDVGQYSFNTYAAIGSSSGTYLQVDNGDAYTPMGTLDSAYSGITADIDTTNDLVITPATPDKMTFLQNFLDNNIKTGENLIYITDTLHEEIAAFRSITYNSGTGKYTISDIWRGLMDTVPRAWSSGTQFWFFSYGAAQPTQTYAATDDVYVKVTSNTSQGESLATTPELLEMTNRALRPYPPGYFRINSSTSTVNISSGTNIQVDWTHRNRIEQGETLITQFDTTITNPEGGTEYYIKFFGETNNLLRTVGPLTTTTYIYLNATQVSDNASVEPKIVTVQLFSKCQGIFSRHAQQRTLIRPGGVAPAEVDYTPTGETFTPTPIGSASYILGFPVGGGPPSSGNTLYFNGTSWVPSNLNGDVTGGITTNTVIKLQNRALASTAPSDRQVIGWDNAATQWQPKNIIDINAVGTTKTAFASSSTNITTNNSYVDIDSMSLTISPFETSILECNFVCEIVGTSASAISFGFRFVLDGSTNSETWTFSENVFPSNDKTILVNVASTFSSVASGSRAVKVQFIAVSGVDVTINNRRLTVKVGKP